MTSLTQLRAFMATSSYFAPVRQRSHHDLNSSVLPKLTSGGNLLAGASARVAVGFLLNPFTLLKARFEVGILLLLFPLLNPHFG
jgi:solute carrier family 25, member 38